MAGTRARVLKARLEGVAAARAGKTAADCPFIVDSTDAVEAQEARAWTSGFARASRRRRSTASA